MPETLSDQTDVVSFLVAEAGRKGGRASVRHIETHLSHVVLTPSRVLKLKKAIVWTVVDYGSVRLRELACRRELAVNAAAGGLYRGVRPIVSDGEAFRLADDTPQNARRAVDWVVEMNRFADGAQFDELFEAGEFSGELAERTAEVIAAGHRSAPKMPQADRADAVASRITQLAIDTGARCASPLLAADIATWRAHASDRLRRLEAKVNGRGRHGFVRRCHGDLHLSNLCLWQGEPTPFDAIEFSEEIATVDVLYDLAFLVADLSHRGGKDVASRLLSRYLEETRDYGGLALLPLFTSMRSMVRALVALAKGREPAPHVADALSALERAPPRLVAVGGLSGTGKSTLARALCEATGAPVVRSDRVRKRLLDLPAEQKAEGWAYTQAMTRRTYRSMLSDAGRALRAGASVILDATFTDAAARGAAGALAEKCGVPFQGFWLEAPVEELVARVEARRGDISDADADVVRTQAASTLAPEDWLRLDALDTLEANLARLRAHSTSINAGPAGAAGLTERSTDDATHEDLGEGASP